MRQLITTALLGQAGIPNRPFERPDGTPYRLDTDHSGTPRNAAHPFPGPLELPAGGMQRVKVW